VQQKGSTLAELSHCFADLVRLTELRADLGRTLLVVFGPCLLVEVCVSRPQVVVKARLLRCALHSQFGEVNGYPVCSPEDQGERHLDPEKKDIARLSVFSS